MTGKGLASAAWAGTVAYCGVRTGGMIVVSEANARTVTTQREIRRRIEAVVTKVGLPAQLIPTSSLEGHLSLWIIPASRKVHFPR